MRALNEAQLAAARADRSACVEAGAGSGKTETLVAAILGWLESPAAGEKPDILNVLALTFTEKAAAELRMRLAAAFEERRRRAEEEGETSRADFWQSQAARLDRADVGTIHSYALKLIRENAPLLGLAAAPELDEGDLAADVDELFLDWLDEGRPELLSLLEIYRPSRLKEMLAGCVERQTSCGLPRLEISPPPAEAERLSRLEELRTLARRTADDLRAGGLVKTDRKYYKNIMAAAEGLEARLAQAAADTPALRRLLQKSGDWYAAREHKAALSQALEALEAVQDQILAQPALEKALVLLNQAPERLEEIRRRRGVLNFNDLLILARRLLARFPEVGRREAARLRLIFIDEFQDTNRPQTELLTFLTLPPKDRDDPKNTWSRLDQGALFYAYGDLKQSIYRFRGAEPKIMRGFKKALRGLDGPRIFDLKYNYRSQAPLVEFFNVFFRDQLEDFAPQAAKRPALYAGPHIVRLSPAGAPAGAPPRLMAEKMEESASLLTLYLERLFSGEAGVLVGDGRLPEPGDVAVLFRRGLYAGAFQRACREAGWPAVLGRGEKLFDYAETRGLAAAFLYLNGLSPELNLAAALRSPLGPVSDETLLRLIWSPEPPARLGEYFRSRPWPEGLPEDDLATLKELKILLDRLTPLVGRVPPVEILEALTEERRLLPLAALEDDGEARARATTACLALSRTLGKKPLNPAEELALLLRNREGPPETDFQKKAITLLTVHKAKGLEFPIVVIAEADLAPRAFYPGPAIISGDGRLALSFKDRTGRRVEPASYRALRQEEDDLEKEESRRLLYVAATRARDHLVFLGRPTPPAKKKPAPSPDDSWLEALLNRPEAAALTGAVAFDRQAESRREEREAPAATARRPPANPDLSLPAPPTGWGLSVTKLAGLLAEEDPALPDDEPPHKPTLTSLSPAAAGTLFHAVMEIIDPREPYPRELLEAEALRLGLSPSAADLGRLIAHIEGFLEGPLGQAWRAALAAGRKIFREWPFQLSMPEPAGTGRYLNVNGVMDLFMETERGGLIVDYKLARPAEGRRLQVYENQLALYALALRAAGWSGPLEGRLYFAEGPHIRPVAPDAVLRPGLWAEFFKNFF